VLERGRNQNTRILRTLKLKDFGQIWLRIA
jgi:hypothetical protein